MPKTRHDYTAEEYRKMTGFLPVYDDLDRLNCTVPGTVDHYQCGYCRKHKKPRHICCCIAIWVERA
jgi:hypothetical protein